MTTSSRLALAAFLVSSCGTPADKPDPRGSSPVAAQFSQPARPAGPGARAPSIDAFRAAPARAPAEALRAAARPFALAGSEVQVDERLGTPTFLWVAPALADAQAPALPVAAPGGSLDFTAAARGHLARLGPLYGLGAGDVAAAAVDRVHDTGRGAVVARLRRQIDGVEVFREQLSVVMRRDGSAVALAGSLSAGLPLLGGFARGAAESVAAAVALQAGIPFPAGAVAPGGSHGGYDLFELSVPDLASAGLVSRRAARARPVWFRTAAGLAPGWYVEAELLRPASRASSFHAAVISAQDGTVLFRKDLVADASYRVWADPADPLHAPLHGPQGNGYLPSPQATPDGSLPVDVFVAPSLLTLQNLAVLAGTPAAADPWLPPGAADTSGNNAAAYADLAAPDGFGAGDLRATATAADTFDRVYDTTRAPGSSPDQQMAAVTQLFYDVNFFHDWYYASGFDEAAGNGQVSNHGRGGLEGDPLLAEAQDFGGTNNANMATPADGSSPRMQMYVWDGPTDPRVVVTAPALGTVRTVGVPSGWGPGSWDLGPAAVVLGADGVASPDVNDGCEPLTGSYAGQIVFLDRGTCLFVEKSLNAQAAGAAGLVIGNIATSPAVGDMGGTPASPITIPVMLVDLSTADALRAALAAGAVTAELVLPASLARDGTIDNQIVAHEWGHYISNRLIGDASGLSTKMSGGLGEGWADFHALLLSVKAGSDLAGAYPLAGYAAAGVTRPPNPYYFGIRRYPYSTDLSRNPLTFKHIADSAVLPAGPPAALNGAPNSEVHNTGEVWTEMLWEAYAALLRDSQGASPRLTFDQARDRMKDYLVAAYRVTPLDPTLLEARDALLAVAAAADRTDFALLAAAFARRGAGVGAVAPDRNAAGNEGVVESFLAGGGLQVTGVGFQDDVHAVCTADGILDGGESGTLTFSLRNIGTTSLAATAVNVASRTAGIAVGNGGAMLVPATDLFGSATATIPVTAGALSGITPVDLTVSVPDVGVGDSVQTFLLLANYDDVPAASATDDAESPVTTWTNSAASGSPPPVGWARVTDGAAAHHYRGPDPSAGPADLAFVSPPLPVAIGVPLHLSFRHRFSFEVGAADNFDGGVVELSSDGGGSWSDIGPFVDAGTTGYNGALSTCCGSPLGNRSAFVGQSAGYPGWTTTGISLGSAHAGATVRVRFRIAADQAGAGPGWDLDDIAFTGLAAYPFHALMAHSDTCNPQPPPPPPTGTAGGKAKSGCGCGAGAEGAPGLLAGLLAFLAVRRGRASR